MTDREIRAAVEDVATAWRSLRPESRRTVAHANVAPELAAALDTLERVWTESDRCAT